jgi:hypothetical protein
LLLARDNFSPALAGLKFLPSNKTTARGRAKCDALEVIKIPGGNRVVSDFPIDWERYKN